MIDQIEIIFNNMNDTQKLWTVYFTFAIFNYIIARIIRYIMRSEINPQNKPTIQTWSLVFFACSLVGTGIMIIIGVLAGLSYMWSSTKVGKFLKEIL